MSNLNYPRPLEPIMIFIDGGYLRRLFVDLFGDDKIDFDMLRVDLMLIYSDIWANPFDANLVRTYYYDGITDEKEKEHAQQREYFDALRENYIFLDVVLGEAVKLPDGTFRQKGVDILMAVDVLTMAYQDHFDSGLFFLGDRDFIPLIEAVKSSGKKTFLFSYIEKVPKELIQTFDFRHGLDKTRLERWRIKNKKM